MRAAGPPAYRAVLKGARTAFAAAPRRWLSQATEPHVLFPAIAVVVLAVIWGTTVNLIRVDRAAAERAAATSVIELSATYESQVIRALREIDQTLKLVKFAYELRGKAAVLGELKDKALLPPDLLFVVSIADSKGDIVASTRPAAMTNVAGQDIFVSQLPTDAPSIGRPRQSPGSGEWKLQFSRRLDAADGRFAGIVLVSVDADYFVSGYEASKLGEHGMLGLFGADGVFRARRSGATLSAGGMVDYPVQIAADEEQGEATLSINSWDGVQRYTSTHKLYEFPLIVIVGLSADEQLAATRREMRAYLWRAFAGSLLLILVVAVLGRMSSKLALARRLAVEEHLAHAARIEHLAYHDGLTALPNRSLFSKLLGQSINQSRRNHGHLAVLFLDLDHFKRVNDTLGHEAGDQLLQEIAHRLKACLRESDTVARIGGDEFVAMLPDLSEEKYAATVAQKILSAVTLPFVLLGQDYRITASIGISICPQDGLDEQSLTKNADTAMYQAKAAGKNNFRFYSDQLNAGSLERLTLEARLRDALARDEFELHYQTKRDTRSGRITGVEALLRWQHPDLGTVAPMQFIPVAEETGLIVPIGKWVLRTACLQSVAWQKLGLPRLSMAVNLTARQFADEQLLPALKAILAESGMDARLLELEITEGMLMRDVEKAMRVLTALKDLGVRIAIDNFGIGYSSLSRLRQFPLDTIKIDRSFIRDIASVADSKGLAKAIIELGRTLSLNVVAQGVETGEQADFLRRNSCNEFQGFYLDKPVPANQIAEMLQAQPDVAGSDTLAAA